MANKLVKKKSVQKVVKKARPAEAAQTMSATPAAKGAAAPTVKMPTGDFVAAVGRRKTANARVRLYKEPGDFIVNGKVVGQYFANVINAPTIYNLPFLTTDTLGKYAVSVKVAGSGLNGQLGAVCHGISRALIKLDPELRTLLKKRGLLSRDDRMKETRKIGTGGKARRTKQSPKR